MNEIGLVGKDLDVLDHAPVGMFVLQKDSVVLFWNNCLEYWTGIPRSEIVGTKIGDHFLHLNEPIYSSRLQVIFEGGPPAIFSSQLHGHIIPSPLPSGQLRIQHTAVTAVPASDGEGFYALFAIQDVTDLTHLIEDYRAMRDQALEEARERKRAEDALRKQTCELSERVKQLNCLYGIANLLGIQGVSLDEMLHMTVELIPPACQHPEITCARITLQGQEFRTGNFRETIWKQAHDIAVYGERIGALEVCYLGERPERDEGLFLEGEKSLFSAVAEALGAVIEGKRVEDALRIRDSAIASSINAIAIADLESNLTYVNRSFLRLWGYDSDEEVLGKHSVEFWQSEEKALEALEASRDGGSWMGELVARRKDGSSFDVQLSASVVIDEVGRPICVMTSCVDITERRRAEEALRERTAQLEAANKELEAFTYSVSHDLRAPLRSIDGFSLALLEDYADKLDEDGQDYLRRVRAASQRMAQLIEDLLKLSRLTRREVRRETVDLSTLAQEIVAELEQREPDRQVEFVVGEGVVTDGDAGLLRVVLENLLGNAWKFTTRHPRATIEFGVTRHDGQAAYFVRDDGAGFDTAYADRLFGAFQRLHSEKEFEGTGIGLATVQRIIHRHGGRVWAEGAVGQGATFYFTL